MVKGRFVHFPQDPYREQKTGVEDLPTLVE